MRVTAATPRGLTIDAVTHGMNYIDALQTQRPHATGREDVVLITHADTDPGYRLACRLLARGVRVVVVARHASSIARIMHGHSTFNVMAIAADVEDASQLAAVLARAESRLGHVATIVDGRGSMGGGAQRPVRLATCASPERQPSRHR